MKRAWWIVLIPFAIILIGKRINRDVAVYDEFGDPIEQAHQK